MLTLALAGAIAICAQSGDGPPSDAQRRQALQSLSKAAPNVRWDINSMVVGDIACDGRSDQVYFGHAGDKIYVGLFRSRDKRNLRFSSFASVPAISTLFVKSQPSWPSSRSTTISIMRREDSKNRGFVRASF
jgi:hypothetical protein